MAVLLLFMGLAMVLPLVLILTGVRGEVVLAFACVLLVAIVFKQIHVAALFNALGWAMSLFGLLPLSKVAQRRKRPMTTPKGST